MLRTELPLKVGEAFGCEFAVFDSPLIDISAVAVSQTGKLYDARFQAGPISEHLIQDAIDNALASADASILSINDLHGRKVMRIAGGLNGSLQNDFMHGLTRASVDELDLSAVTGIDSAGLELCRIASEQYRVGIVRPSPCVHAAMTQLNDRS